MEVETLIKLSINLDHTTETAEVISIYINTEIDKKYQKEFQFNHKGM